ncbi:MAG TPA: hypothetical protein VG227_08485 [Caulobacteraceae bacterium]|jgi:hypothetical protein|nr:hypothetical protein [Caulobacteraceae bacterium]
MNELRKATLLAAASAIGLSLGATIADAQTTPSGSGGGTGKVSATWVKGGATGHSIKYDRASSTQQKAGAQYLKYRPATAPEGGAHRLNPQPLPPG